MKKFTLNNGVEIPSIGFGTWQIEEGEKAYHSVITALEAGYRHIDTAAVYGNEKSIGRALRDFGLPRKEIFLTTKLWNTDRSPEKVKQALHDSMEKLQVDYLDLYLIHWPANAKQHPSDWAKINSETWKELCKAYENKTLRAIGVSNFMIEHLETLLASTEVKPSVNQIEFHPGWLQPKVIDFCKKNDIALQAWSPLGSGRVLDHPVLRDLAERYDVNVGQLCVKFVLQSGIICLPKSETPQNIKLNINVDNFELSAKDFELIKQLPEIGFSGLDPHTVDF
ncbi:aldo/keto reductase [Weeksella virosa]|uniref:aldo/keto reductase n=1 Tax=Weeksella virosa TaxID=1014 RepID=UPI0025558F22|nr:aldo/keto reductase [Weeksella virosa]MDK7375681.1 aldo/keto reductase [Weeksella virosa]